MGATVGNESPTRAPSRWRRARRLLAACALAAAIAGEVSAAPALGLQTHAFSFSFAGSGDGALSMPSAVAIDNRGGAVPHDVYVTDSAAHLVEKFDAGGNFILAFGDQASVGDGAFIAVDDSGGPSGGDVYVGEATGGRISKFDSSGNPIVAWGSGGLLSLPYLAGIAVDPDGNLFAIDPVAGTISEFGQDGSSTTSFAVPRGTTIYGLALDSAGDFFKSNGDGSVEKFSPTLDFGQVSTAYTTSGLAVDASNGDLYVDMGSRIEHFPFDGTEITGTACAPGYFRGCPPADEFGDEDLSDGGGIAVDAATHAVYAAARGAESVDVFAAALLPDVTADTIVDPGDVAATATGSVDPAGGGNVTACRFEVVDQAQFVDDGYAGARSFPCSPTPPYSGRTDVVARLTGLTPQTTYHYRLVAANAQGSHRGGDRTFLTSILPVVDTGAATGPNPGQTSATLNGTVDTHGGGDVVSCHFDVIDQAHFASGGYAGAYPAPCSPSPPYAGFTDVTAHLTGLQPGTTYHYRLVAASHEGTSTGLDRALVTLPGGEIVPPPKHPKPVVHRRVPCSRKACTRTLTGTDRLQTWVSPKFPAASGWLFAVYRNGRSLHNTNIAGGCVGTFTGTDMIATVNGCRGRFRLTYLGAVTFRVRWRIFARCDCAKQTNR